MDQSYGNLNSLKTFMNKDVEANMKAVQNAWTNSLMAVAGPNSQNVISVLQTLTGAINSTSAAINRMDPNTITRIGEAFAILAGSLVLGGLATIAEALGPAGWLVAGIVALGAALTLLWPSIKALA